MNTIIATRPRTIGLLLGALALALPALLLTGCNTVEGAGEDVSAVGRGVTYGADRTQQAIFSERE